MYLCTMRRITLLLTLLLPAVCVACATAPRLEGDERTILERIRALRALRHDIAAVWPGYDAPQYDVPLLYYTDSVCYAVNPTAEMCEHFGGRIAHEENGLRIYRLSLPDTLPFHMETQIEFLDSTCFAYRRPYLCCSSPELTGRMVPDVTSDSTWMPMVLHEYAHGYQYSHPELTAHLAHALPTYPEAEFSRLHLEYEWFNAAIRDENQALLDALAAATPDERTEHIDRFFTLRAGRKARMAAELGAAAVSDEEFYEYMEGMARFFEAEAGFRLGSYTDRDTWLHDTDHSGYFFATGYNLVRLLEQLGYDLPTLYEGTPRPLERDLRAATAQRTE